MYKQLDQDISDLRRRMALALKRRDWTALTILRARISEIEYQRAYWAAMGW